jgi:hypothetical protein
MNKIKFHLKFTYLLLGRVNNIRNNNNGQWARREMKESAAVI